MESDDHPVTNCHHPGAMKDATEKLVVVRKKMVEETLDNIPQTL